MVLSFTCIYRARASSATHTHTHTPLFRNNKERIRGSFYNTILLSIHHRLHNKTSAHYCRPNHPRPMTSSTIEYKNEDGSAPSYPSSTNATTGSPGLLCHGIFQYELANCMLNSLERRSFSFLQKLQSLCHQYNGQERVHENFVLGLGQIEGWGDDVLMQEIEALQQDCSEITKVYGAIIQKYITEFFRGFSDKQSSSVINKKRSICVPSLGKFIKHFYMALARDDAVQSMRVFQMYSVNRKFIFMNAFRQALCEVLQGPLDLLLKELPPSSSPPPSPSSLRLSAAAEPLSVKHNPASIIPPSARLPSAAPPPTPNPDSLFKNYVDDAIRDVQRPHNSGTTKDPRASASSATLYSISSRPGAAAEAGGSLREPIHPVQSHANVFNHPSPRGRNSDHLAAASAAITPIAAVASGNRGGVNSGSGGARATPSSYIPSPNSSLPSAACRETPRQKRDAASSSRGGNHRPPSYREPRTLPLSFHHYPNISKEALKAAAAVRGPDNGSGGYYRRSKMDYQQHPPLSVASVRDVQIDTPDSNVPPRSRNEEDQPISANEERYEN